MSTTASTTPRFREPGAGAFIERNGLFVFCLVLTIGAALFAPGFRSPNNLQNVLTNAAPLGVVVLGPVLWSSWCGGSICR